MENTFAVLWLQIITTQWTNICLVNISSVNSFLMIVILFEFHHALSFHVKESPSYVLMIKCGGYAARRVACWLLGHASPPNPASCLQIQLRATLHFVCLDLFHSLICADIIFWLSVVVCKCQKIDKIKKKFVCEQETMKTSCDLRTSATETL